MSKITVSELVNESPIDIEATVPLFERAWHSTIKAMFDMLELIQTHQNRPGFEKLCEALDNGNIIKRSVMSMLRSIIANPVLMEPKKSAITPTLVQHSLDSHTDSRKGARRKDCQKRVITKSYS
jgi:hypothetical protein